MRRLLLAILLLLGFCGPAQAAVICNQNSGAVITGASWSQYDGLLVTTGSTDSTHIKVSSLGLKTVTNNLWTVRSAATTGLTLPSGSTATGYLETAVNSAAASIQIDSTGTALEDTVAGGGTPTGDNVHYWQDFWVMAAWDGSAALPATAQVGLFTIPTQVTGLNSHRIVYNGTTAIPAPGWAIYSQNTSTGTASRGVFPLATSGGVTHYKFNDWVRITIHYKYAATTSGITEVYANGVLVFSVIGDTTTTNTNWSTSTLALTFPQWAGVQWRVCGTIATYNGTDIVCSPLWNQDAKATDLVTRVYMPWNVLAAAGQGSFFTSSGTGTVATDSEYATAVGSPGRHRLVFSGNGNNPVATTFDEIGALPFNEQGWATVALSDFYVPNGTLLSFKICEAGGTNELVRVTVTGGSTTSQVNVYSASNDVDDSGSGFQAMLLAASADRYCMALHFNQDGRVRMSVCDLTATYDGSAKTAYSAPLADWIPQPLGKISITCSTNASNVEMGYIAICRRASFSTIDSLTSASYATSPVIYGPTCVHHSLPYGEESTTIPGGYYPQKENGLTRRVLIAPLGRPGKTRRDWQQCVGSLLTHMHGCEFVAIDGGSINDITTIGNGDGEDALAFLRDNIEQFLKWAVEHDNAVWMTTMLPRGRSVTATSTTGTTTLTVNAASHGVATSVSRVYLTGFGGNIDGLWSSGVTTGASSWTITGASGTGTYSNGTVTGFTPTETAVITLLNADIRSLVAKYQSKGLLSLSDLEADVAANASLYPNTGGATGQFWQDFTHPNTTTRALGEGFGAGTVASRMAITRVTPPSTVPPRRMWIRSTN